MKIFVVCSYYVLFGFQCNVCVRILWLLCCFVSVTYQTFILNFVPLKNTAVTKPRPYLRNIRSIKNKI